MRINAFDSPEEAHICSRPGTVPFFSSQMLIPFVTEIPCTEVPAQTKREDPDSKYFLRWNQVILTISHDIIVYGILYEMFVKKIVRST
jgi:hypothetical protein